MSSYMSSPVNQILVELSSTAFGVQDLTVQWPYLYWWYDADRVYHKLISKLCDVFFGRYSFPNSSTKRFGMAILIWDTSLDNLKLGSLAFQVAIVLMNPLPWIIKDVELDPGGKCPVKNMATTFKYYYWNMDRGTNEVMVTVTVRHNSDLACMHKALGVLSYFCRSDSEMLSAIATLLPPHGPWRI